MKKDLSVQITYRQILYNSIISYRDGTLHLRLISDETYPNGVMYEVTSSDIIISYEDITKSYSSTAFTDSFVPKLLYSFFSVCGETLVTERESGEGSCIERNINGNSISFQIKIRNGVKSYYIEIK